MKDGLRRAHVSSSQVRRSMHLLLYKNARENRAWFSVLNAHLESKVASSLTKVGLGVQSTPWVTLAASPALERALVRVLTS